MPCGSWAALPSLCPICVTCSCSTERLLSPHPSGLVGGFASGSSSPSAALLHSRNSHALWILGCLPPPSQSIPISMMCFSSFKRPRLCLFLSPSFGVHDLPSFFTGLAGDDRFFLVSLRFFRLVLLGWFSWLPSVSPWLPIPALCGLGVLALSSSRFSDPVLHGSVFWPFFLFSSLFRALYRFFWFLLSFLMNPTWLVASTERRGGSRSAVPPG
jgi:hypothetical protein